MYSKITNPLTGRKVNINSKLGKKVLKNYLLQLKGGSNTDEDMVYIKSINGYINKNDIFNPETDIEINNYYYGLNRDGDTPVIGYMAFVSSKGASPGHWNGKYIPLVGQNTNGENFNNIPYTFFVSMVSLQPPASYAFGSS